VPTFLPKQRKMELPAEVFGMMAAENAVKS